MKMYEDQNRGNGKFSGTKHECKLEPIMCDDSLTASQLLGQERKKVR